MFPMEGFIGMQHLPITYKQIDMQYLLTNKIQQNLLCLTDTHAINTLHLIVLFYVFI
jgi:hypothetical protein